MAAVSTRTAFHLKLWLGLALPLLLVVWWASVRYARHADHAAAPSVEVVRGAPFTAPPPTAAPTSGPASAPAETKAPPAPRSPSTRAALTADEAAAAAAPPLPPPPKDGKYEPVPFDTLASFLYFQSTEGVPAADTVGAAEGGVDINRIPAAILALDGHRIVVTGYMMPTAIREEGVQAFLLVRDPMLCCWGMKLAMMNEWIRVDMVDGKFANYAKHVPAIVRGKLSVGEEYSEGIVTSIFRMTADSVELTGGY